MKSRLNTIFIFLFAFMAVHAGEPDSLAYVSPASFDLMPVFNPWLQSTNPAGLRFNPDLEPGRLDLNYRGESGDYKKAMHGDTLQSYSLQMERYKRIKRTIFYGNFAYDKSLERGLNFSEMNDPYLGTPYLLIDTMARNDVYNREFFTLRGDISTPVFNILSWGLSVDMNVGLSAQDRDPRPRNKVMNLDVSQGLLLATPHLSIGANGLFSYYNEDIEVDIIQKNIQLAFLQLHGFDNYTYHVAGSFGRLYERMTYGGEGQLNLKIGGLNSLFGGKFLYFSETTDDARKAGNASWAHLKNDAELEGNEFEIYNASTLRHGNILHALNATYRMRYFIGAEIIQRLEQVGDAGAVGWVDYGSEEKYASSLYMIDFGYRFLWMKDSFRKNLEIGLGINSIAREKAYYLPDMQEQYKNRILSASVGKSFYVGRHECVVGAAFKMKKSLNFYRDFDETSFISEKVLLPDFAYLTSGYTAPSVNITYAYSLKRFFNKIYLRSDVTWYKGDHLNIWSADLDRTFFNFRTGVIL